MEQQWLSIFPIRYTERHSGTYFGHLIQRTKKRCPSSYFSDLSFLRFKVARSIYFVNRPLLKSNFVASNLYIFLRLFRVLNPLSLNFTNFPSKVFQFLKTGKVAAAVYLPLPTSSISSLIRKQFSLLID